MAVSKSARRWFSEFDNVYAPIVICSERGRIVYKNDIAKRILDSLKPGSLMNKYFKTPFDGKNHRDGARAPALFRLKEEKGCFRDALRFDINAGDEVYSGYLFDFSFACLDADDLQNELAVFGDRRLTVDADGDFAKCRQNVLFSRFCDSLYEKIFSYIENDGLTEAGDGAQRLINSLRELMCNHRVDVGVVDISVDAANALISDRSFFICFMHMLMFYIKLVDPRRMSISARKHGDVMETLMTAQNVRRFPSASGDIDDFADAFPNMRVASRLIRAVLSARGIEFSFEVDPSYIVVSQRQKLLVEDRIFMHQTTDVSDLVSEFFGRVMDAFLFGVLGE